MKVLLVDDQRAIVESISNGIQWDKLGIEEKFIACSAAEAKLILVNFDIDIMLCDIEMPGEDGIALLQWTKKQNMEVCCIFLTAHAEFEYARKAIALGGFDYILQPVKYAEIEKVLLRAVEQVRKTKNVEWMQKTQKELLKNRDIFLAALLYQLKQKDYKEAQKAFAQFTDIMHLDHEHVTMYSAKCYYKKKDSKIDNWDTELKLFVTRNVLEELLENKVKVAVAEEKGQAFFVLVLDDSNQINDECWQSAMEHYYRFMTEQMASNAAIYTGKGKEVSNEELPRELITTYEATSYIIEPELNGIHWEEKAKERELEEKDERIEKVMEYVKAHVYQNISRSEAAELVYLNQEYFSKLFRAQTGMTFKDYVLMEKMNTAQNLLKNTNLSIGVIASKLGFDNFSHFSKTFKKATDYTPQEYRSHEKIQE